MTYQEMQAAAAELEAATSAPARKASKQRGATKAQLAHRAKLLGTCPDCGMARKICRAVGGCQP